MCRSVMLIPAGGGGEGGGDDAHIKVTEMHVGKLKLNPQRRPMWVRLKLKLTTPKGDHTKTDVSAFLVNFSMHSPKRYLNGQI